MLQKIKAALLIAAKDMGFDSKFIDAMAAYLATTVTDENQVEEAVKAFEPLLKANQGEVDRRIQKAAGEAGKSDPQGGTDNQPAGGGKTETGKEGDSEVMTLLRALTSEVASLKSEKSTATRTSKLEAKLANASDAFKKTTLNAFKRMNFEKDEDFDAYLQEVEEDAKAFVQTEADRKLGAQGKPALPAGGSGTDVKPATKEELDKLMPAL